MTCLVSPRHLFPSHLAAIGLLTLAGCGSEPLPITPMPQDLAPAWHPQGQQIALQHEGLNETSGVYLAGVGTTERQLLLAGEVGLRRHSGADLHVGAEWKPMSPLALRAGYESLANPDVTGDRDGRWSAGTAFQIGPAALGIAVRFGGLEGGEELFVGLDAF